MKVFIIRPRSNIQFPDVLIICLQDQLSSAEMYCIRR